MKKYLFSITLALFFLFSCVKPQQTGPHFVVPEGNPFMPMHVFALEATIDGKHLGTGDEIGIFDITTCVGAKILEGKIDREKPLQIITTSDDTIGGIGFTAGHVITFKFWDKSKQTEYFAEAKFLDILTGEPINPQPFERLGTALVVLKNK